MKNPAISRRNILTFFSAAPFFHLFKSGISEDNSNKLTDFTLHSPKADYKEPDRYIESNTLIIDCGELGSKPIFKFEKSCNLHIKDGDDSPFFMSLLKDNALESITCGSSIIKWEFKTHHTTMDKELLSRIKGAHNDQKSRS